MEMHAEIPAPSQPAPTVTPAEHAQASPNGEPVEALALCDAAGATQAVLTANALELQIDQLLLHISPSAESLAKRKRVVEYVQRLVQKHFLGIGYEVRPRRAPRFRSTSSCHLNWTLLVKI